MNLNARLVFAIALCWTSWAFAELPQSVDEVLFGICGGTNYEDYVKWLKTDGTKAFDRAFVIFDKAQFRMHYPTNDFAPRHYSIEMEREFTDESSSTNLVGLMQQAESILLKSFVGQKFKRQYDGVHYQSSCMNIDGRGWNANFSVLLLSDKGKTSYVAKAKFFNPLHQKGRSVSCEDFADASKSKPNLPEVFSIPVDMGGWNVQMIGSGVCQLEKPFFLFDVVTFKSSDPTETEPSHVYEIELEYERPRSADMNIAVSAIKDAEGFLAEYFYFLGESFERKNGKGHYISTSSDVDGRGWRAEFEVRQDVKRDKYVAHALFKRSKSAAPSAGNALKERQIESHAEETRKQQGRATRDDVYVAVTTNAFNPLIQKLGVHPYPVDLHGLDDETRYDMSSKCVLMFMLPSEYDKSVVDSLVRSCGIQVAFVSPDEQGDGKLNELKTLIDLMVETRADRMAKRKQMDSEKEEEFMARHKKILDTELFGPYHVDNLTLVEVVESLFLRVNGDLKPYDFSLGMGLGMKGASEEHRYKFLIPRAHVAEIFSHAATQMNCTVTNNNGFISFTYKSSTQEDQDGDK